MHRDGPARLSRGAALWARREGDVAQGIRQAPVGAHARRTLALHAPMPLDARLWDGGVPARTVVICGESRAADDEGVLHLDLVRKVEEEPDAVVEQLVAAVDEVTVLVHVHRAKQLVEHLPLLHHLEPRPPRATVVPEADAARMDDVIVKPDGVVAEAGGGGHVVLAVDVSATRQILGEPASLARHLEPHAGALVDGGLDAGPDAALPSVNVLRAAHIAAVQVGVAEATVAHADHRVVKKVGVRVREPDPRRCVVVLFAGRALLGAGRVL
eukprot:6559394-Prymnesium_polylepis.2